MFSQTPDIYVRSNKENKKIFSLFKNTDVLDEISKDINKSHISYNCIIITKDNKMILCNRRLSFYASYIVHQLQKNLTSLDTKRFLNCVKNLNLKEFIVLYYTLYQNNLINIKEYINPEVFEYICNFKDIKPYIKIPKKLFNIYPFLVNSLIKILIDFANNKLILKDNNNIILPGGKKKYYDESPLNVLKRELFEELNLNICNVKYLDKCYNFKNIDENIIPVLCMYNHDKILNFNYLDLTYIIKTDYTFKEIEVNFKKNFEIYNLYSSNTIKINTNMLSFNTIKLLLKIYIKYI